MGYVEEIFERANLNSIRHYLEYETPPLHKKVSGDFENRLHNAQEKYRSQLMVRLPDSEENEEVFSELATLLTETELVYLEIGILVGIQITNEIKHLSKLIK